MLTKRLVFVLVILLLVLPGPVAYGYDRVFASGSPARIEVAAPAPAPVWQAYRHAAGSIDRPQDLYYVHAGDKAVPMTATLYLTNVDELARSYRYFVLQVGVYVADDAGGWTRAGQAETTLNLGNGRVSFPLAGAAEYKVGIDGGSFYCIGAGGANGESSLRFNLEIAAASET